MDWKWEATAALIIVMLAYLSACVDRKELEEKITRLQKELFELRKGNK